jgi:lysozyme family protein
MASFALAMTYLLTLEGGFSNNVHDHGGETKFGITQQTFTVYMRGEFKQEEWDTFGISEAQQIYYNMFWQEHRLGEIGDQAIANVMFDQIVNRGPSAAIKRAQLIVKESSDGILGSETLAAINKQDPKSFVTKYALRAQIEYSDIVKSDKSQVEFISGWLKRTHEMLAQVGIQ